MVEHIDGTARKYSYTEIQYYYYKVGNLQQKQIQKINSGDWVLKPAYRIDWVIEHNKGQILSQFHIEEETKQKLGVIS